MAVTDRNTLKSWFKRGLKPLAIQFASWMDSFWHKTEDLIPIDVIEGLREILAGKIDRSEIENITKDIMLERRIQLTMERTSQDMFFGESMTIYYVESNNVASMSMTIGNVVTQIELDKPVTVQIPVGSVVFFNIIKQFTDPTAYLYIKAKV